MTMDDSSPLKITEPEPPANGTDDLPFLWGFVGVFLVQSWPILLLHSPPGQQRLAAFAYFWTTAILAIYLGSLRAKPDEVAELEMKTVLLAPIASSISLFGLYLLMKSGLDPGAIYKGFACLFALLSVQELAAEFFGWLLPDAFREQVCTLATKSITI